MTKRLSVVLIIALFFLLCVPAGAQAPIGTIPPAPHFGGVSSGEIAGIVVGVVVPVVIITVVLVRHSHRGRTITGCVTATQNGFAVSNEKDKLVYALSGSTAGVKAGERMRLQGHKIDPNAGSPLGWEVSQIQKDYGPCQL